MNINNRQINYVIFNMICNNKAYIWNNNILEFRMNRGLSPIPVMLKSPFWGVGRLSFWRGRDCPLKPAGNFAAFFSYHPHFQYYAIFLAATPHTLKRQKAAKSSKKRLYYTPQSGHGAIITHQTPVSCVKVCKNYLSLCKSVQWTFPLWRKRLQIRILITKYQLPTTN